MELKVKFLKWTAGLPVVMLHKKTADKIGVHIKDRISIKTLTKSPKEMTTIIDITEKMVQKDEIATSSEIKKRMNLRIGQKVDINLAPSPKSLVFIKNKLNNKPLSKKEVNEIIKDVVNNSLSEAEIALFVSAIYKHKMNFKEAIYLIEAISRTGNQLKLKNKFIVDKHSIGGIPGNRTTPIIVSICAAAGLIMPKNSSRAITSAAGTADVIEAIAEVDFSFDEVKKIVKKTNACIVWGGAWGMVPADSKIIKVEKQLKIDSEAQLLASIMSKKLAGGSKYILIDIPYGKTAKVNKLKALHLKKKFEQLGRYFNKKLKCILTDGSQPIGHGVGPILELKDILKILNPEEQGPSDLEKKSLFLAGELLEMTGKAKKNKGIEIAEQILSSGEAFKKFQEIVKAQKGSLDKMNNGEKPLFKKDIIAKKSGKITEIDNIKINSLAKIAGCPVDKFSGLYLHHHVNHTIKKGDKLLTIYAESKSRLNQAIKLYGEKNPLIIK